MRSLNIRQIFDFMRAIDAWCEATTAIPVPAEIEIPTGDAAKRIDVELRRKINEVIVYLRAVATIAPPSAPAGNGEDIERAIEGLVAEMERVKKLRIEGYTVSTMPDGYAYLPEDGQQ